MHAHPLARLALVLSGLAVALGSTGSELAMIAPLVAAGFVVGGVARQALRLAAVLAPMLIFSAMLWVFVNSARVEDVTAQALQLLEPDAPFMRLVRTAVGSSAIVLAVGTIPDGELFVFLRRLAAPPGIATIIASGAAVGAGMPNAFTRSLVALRAHGIIGAGIPSARCRLGARRPRN